MISAYDVSIIAAGVFFLNGLLTGIWKFRQIAASDTATAHPYVDVAHRSLLLYAFAALLIAEFARISQLPNVVELVAASAALLYFGLAITTYMIQGYKQETDNQLREITPATNLFMYSLIAAEVGGFVVLFYGALIELL